MQRPDAAKRQAILDAAAELFASRAFHEVRLEDVAAAAHIGKGTVYIYFQNKQALFLELLRDGFRRLLERIRPQLDCGCAWETLTLIVREIVRWATQHPEQFELMRTFTPSGPDKKLRESRRELAAMIEQTIRRGVKDGLFEDPHPELTAQFVPACVRAALVHGPGHVRPKALVQQVMRMLGNGLRGRGTCH
jgi:AcrR family transcriptional regulator